jgi:hypothetical protein
LEANGPTWFGWTIQVGEFGYMVTSYTWYVVVGIIAIAMLYILNLYAKMGSAAPSGSKLRRRSKLIILGLLLWLVAILGNSTMMREISMNNCSMMELPIYLFLPLVIPGVFLLSLSLLITGFSRE